MRSKIAVVAVAIGLLVPFLVFKAQGLLDLQKPAGKEWATIGGDWSNSRYSTLQQINRGNVKDLKGAWVIHLGSGLGNEVPYMPAGGVTSKYSLEGTPIVKDGVMYVTSGNDDVFALDAKTGALIWEHKSNIDPNISTVCCGWDNRGVALGEGKVFLGYLDGTFNALDAETGKPVWQTRIGNWQDGYTITSAPLYYKGVVYTGVSGGDLGARGKITALDGKTGKELWHFWTTPDPGKLGSDTWPQPNDRDPARARSAANGGASMWQAPAVDPDLGLIYFSTGNPTGSGNTRPGDNLFSSSIMALHLDGTYAWHYQVVHHDMWDFDCPSPVILFDQVYDGVMHKGIAEACKTGWVYMLDRTNGKPLIGIDEKPVEQEPRLASSPTQPFPRGDAVMPQCPQPLPGWQTKCIFGTIYDHPVLISPGGNGGVNWSPMAYSPQTGYFYVTAADRPFPQIGHVEAPPLSPTNTRITNAFLGPVIGAHYSGTFTAIDSRTNKIVWQKKMPYSVGQGSGSLATAGGLVFHGEPDGNFQAYDAKTGDLLWQWQTGAGADAPAITYEIDGTQYVAIAAGGVSTQTVSANGDMIWAFSLTGSPGNRLHPFAAPKPPVTVREITGTIVNTNAVTLVDYAFSPMRITVPVGTKVTFTNNGKAIHNASSSDAGGWDTGMLGAGKSAGVTFNRPGTYSYACLPHSFMIGQIIVTGSPIESQPPVVVDNDATPASSAPAPANMPGHNDHTE
jgi:alcohol dehydrogenase (cytochrome c)